MRACYLLSTPQHVGQDFSSRNGSRMLPPRRHLQPPPLSLGFNSQSTDARSSIYSANWTSIDVLQLPKGWTHLPPVPLERRCRQFNPPPSPGFVPPFWYISQSSDHEARAVLIIYQHVDEFSGEHGSRIIQQKLETANSDEKDVVFSEIRQNSRHRGVASGRSALLQRSAEINGCGDVVFRLILITSYTTLVTGEVEAWSLLGSPALYSLGRSINTVDFAALPDILQTLTGSRRILRNLRQLLPNSRARNGVFGYYVIQKLLEHGNQLQKGHLGKAMNHEFRSTATSPTEMTSPKPPRRVMIHHRTPTSDFRHCEPRAIFAFHEDHPESWGPKVYDQANLVFADERLSGAHHWSENHQKVSLDRNQVVIEKR
jgi:hypothetical protein